MLAQSILTLKQARWASPINFKTVRKFETDASYLKQFYEARIPLRRENCLFSGYDLNIISFSSKTPSLSKFT